MKSSAYCQNEVTIASLAENGLPTQVAKNALTVMQTTRAMMVEHRDRLQRDRRTRPSRETRKPQRGSFDESFDQLLAFEAVAAGLSKLVPALVGVAWRGPLRDQS